MSTRARAWLCLLPLFAAIATAGAAPTRDPISSVFSASDEQSPVVIETVPTDLYGNEVRPAVARYKVDSTGVLYEEHSPETELPRLASPTS